LLVSIVGCGQIFKRDNPVDPKSSTFVPDVTIPTIISTLPADSATGVAINLSIKATFSEDIDSASITTSTFTLMQGGVPVPCTVSYSSHVATLKTVSNLSISTTYTATITTGVKDVSGNALASNITWTFTTGSSTDITAPTVSSTVPTDTSTGVAINASISATFSEAMDSASINTATFTLMQGATAVAGTVEYSGVVAIFRPTSYLLANTVYTATINTFAQDLAGNTLTVNKTWSFTTNSGYSFVLKWGTLGTGDGNFNYPRGIALDSSGDIYVTDSQNSRVQKFHNNGTFINKMGNCSLLGWQFSIAIWDCY